MPEVRKLKRLKDMTAQELLGNYQCTVRESWADNLRRGPGKNPGHNSLYQKELSLKREVLRRLLFFES